MCNRNIGLPVFLLAGLDLKTKTLNTYDYSRKNSNLFIYSFISAYIGVELIYSLTILPMELFLVPASAPRLVYQMPWYMLSCLWDGEYKRTLAANLKE